MIWFKNIYRLLSPKWQNVYLDYRVELKPRYSENSDLPYHEILYDIVRKNNDGYLNLLSQFIEYRDQINSIAINEQDKLEPYWNNGFLPGLDVISLYGMIRYFKPKKYFEIGSGHSTKVAFKAKNDGNLNMDILAIDPQPRSEISGIADCLEKKPIESMNFDDSIIGSIETGDVLFIDSSHRLLPNSDCSFIFTELIPRLPKGVIIQIHDIYLPYDYPQFMCDRLYNEHYALSCYLLSNPDYFEILLPNYYIFKDAEIWKTVSPLFEGEKMRGVEKHGGSIWLRKK